MPDITAAHWIYLVGIVAILVTMIYRKNIIVPAVSFTFLTALVFSGSIVTGLASVFNASLVAAQELFNIFLIIALVTGMLGALRALGADKRMVAPFRGVMRNAHLSWWALIVVTYFISLFFWPTPAVPLIGAVLIPVAIRAGLRPLAVGFTIAIAGQGMALSSDYVIRVAPGLSAKSAGVSADTVANRAFVLSLIVGAVAIGIGYALEFRKMRTPSQQWLDEWETLDSLEGTRIDDNPTVGHGAALREEMVDDPALTSWSEREHEHAHAAAGPAASTTMVEERGGASVATMEELTSDTKVSPAVSKAFAIAVPLAYLALIVYLAYRTINKSDDGSLVGGDAAALVGGIAAVFIFLGALAEGRSTFLERSAEHVVDGLVFAFKAMGVVIPIAGFFFIGNGDFAGRILGVAPGADGVVAGPSFLFDLVVDAQNYIPQNGFVTALGILAIGVVAGLDGSGFSGLPLTGSLAGTLGQVSGVSPETLAAVGQMGNIWSGGGTLVAWSSLIAVAGFARVNVLELARMCFIPVMSGLIIATVVAVAVFG